AFHGGDDLAQAAAGAVDQFDAAADVMVAFDDQAADFARRLAGFWAGAYEAVRKDLRGRYPRHPWPEDPRAAQATARAKPRGT
ncbi:MAG: hypothetical protein HQL41_08430, partial [Alphaproteobacteria bacterium]|nr:hypothetical protein [Alphaproteobacteria bacterium]